MATSEISSNAILRALVAKLSQKPRELVIRRVEHMTRELKYHTERQDENLLFIRSRNWSDGRLTTLFAVNSLYQEVLGPLQSSARHNVAKLGREIPILHGSIRFDPSRNFQINEAIGDFNEMLIKLGFLKSWMTLNTCGDIIYWVARYERDGEQTNDEGNGP